MAVAGLIMNDAICSSGRSSGTGQTTMAGITAYCDQLPPLELCANTRWPTESPSTPGPSLSMTDTLSKPAPDGKCSATPE